MTGTIPVKEIEGQDTGQDPPEPKIKSRSKVPKSIQVEVHNQRNMSKSTSTSSSTLNRLNGKAMIGTGLILSKKLTDNLIDRDPNPVCIRDEKGDGRLEPGASEKSGG